jgi:hypothetical protein
MLDDFLARYRELEGFDLDLVGFHCAGEIEGLRWRCPFQPGCGANMPDDCPLMKRLARISRAARRWQ